MDPYLWFLIVGIPMLALAFIGMYFDFLFGGLEIVLGGMGTFLTLMGLATVIFGGSATQLKTYNSQQGVYCYTIHPSGSWTAYEGVCP